jgi:nicotinic acid phosphoribosyltransferase
MFIVQEHGGMLTEMQVGHNKRRNMTYIFTFSFKEETQEAAYAGNIGIQQALHILQQLVIADAVNKLKEADEAKKVAGQNKKKHGKIENKE